MEGLHRIVFLIKRLALSFMYLYRPTHAQRVFNSTSSPIYAGDPVTTKLVLLCYDWTRADTDTTFNATVNVTYDTSQVVDGLMSCTTSSNETYVTATCPLNNANGSIPINIQLKYHGTSKVCFTPIVAFKPAVPYDYISIELSWGGPGIYQDSSPLTKVYLNDPPKPLLFQKVCWWCLLLTLSLLLVISGSLAWLAQFVYPSRILCNQLCANHLLHLDSFTYEDCQCCEVGRVN